MSNLLLDKVSAKSDKSTTRTSTGNRVQCVSLVYKQTLERWTRKLFEEFGFTDRDFGDYMGKFVVYLESFTGRKWRERQGTFMGYAGRWKGATKDKINKETGKPKAFQRLRINSWETEFIKFCVTGSLNKAFDVDKYLSQGNDSMLTKTAWQYKEIPLIQGNVSELEKENQRLRKELERYKALDNEPFNKGSKDALLNPIPTSFSEVLGLWVNKEAKRIKLSEEIVVVTLANRLGSGASTFIIKEDLIGRIFPMKRPVYKNYVYQIADLGILTKPDGSVYTGKELFALPSGVEFED